MGCVHVYPHARSLFGKGRVSGVGEQRLLDLIELGQSLCTKIHTVGEHIVTETDQVIAPGSQADILSRGTHHLGIGCRICALVLRLDDHIKLCEHEILIPVAFFGQCKAQILPSQDNARRVEISEKLNSAWATTEDLSGFLLNRCILISVDEEVR